MSSEKKLFNVIVADPQPMIGWGLERYLLERELAQVKAFVSDTDSLLDVLTAHPEVDLAIVELALRRPRS